MRSTPIVGMPACTGTPVRSFLLLCLLLGMPLLGQDTLHGPASITNAGASRSLARPTGLIQQSGFTDYDDFDAFEAATGPLVCIPFDDLPAGETVTTQYEASGVVFTDGDDTILPEPGFVRDGLGLDCNGRARLEFRQPFWAVGAFFPGALTIEVFDMRGGRSLHTSRGFGYDGTGHFGGVVSEGAPFAFVEFMDWVDDAAFLDEVCFGILQDPNLELEAKLDLLEPKVDAIDAIATATADAVQDLQVAVQELDAAVAALEGKLDGAEAKADTAGGKLDALEAKADGAGSKLDALEAKGDAADGKLDTLEAKADTADGKLDALTQATSLLEGKADRGESKLDQLEAKLDRLEVRMDRIQLLLCELNRLLLTPEGRRESDVCGPCRSFPDGKLEGGCP